MPIDSALCKTGAYAPPNGAPSIHVQQADARLIAAAPDLLGALIQVRARMASLMLSQDQEGTLQRVNSAIKKAQGDQP